MNQHGVEIVTDSQLVEIHKKITKLVNFLNSTIPLLKFHENYLFSASSTTDIEYALADLEKLFQ